MTWPPATISGRRCLPAEVSGVACAAAGPLAQWSPRPSSTEERSHWPRIACALVCAATSFHGNYAEVLPVGRGGASSVATTSARPRQRSQVTEPAKT